MSLNNRDIRSCMRSAARKGFNPYDNHGAYAAQARRKLADKARRMRDPYPFHISRA